MRQDVTQVLTPEDVGDLAEVQEEHVLGVSDHAGGGQVRAQRRELAPHLGEHQHEVGLGSSLRPASCRVR